MTPLRFFGDIDSQQFVTKDGGTPNLRTFVVGDKPRISFELCELDPTGTEVKLRNDIWIRTIRASLGTTFKEPTAGAFSFTGLGETFSINFDDTAAEVHANITDDVATTQATELLGPSEWRIYLDLADTEPAPTLATTINTLSPRSFVRFRTIKFGGKWTVEIKLLQSPYAFSDAWTRVLPDPPSIEQIRAGNTGDGITETAANEIQAIVVPADFRGTYYITYDYRTTRPLGTDEGPALIEAALNAMYDDGLKRFSVTNPVDTKAYVEFVGLLSSASQDLMTVTVDTFDPGSPQFDFDMNTVEFDAAVRASAKLENVPFEIEVEVVDNEADIEDEEVAGRILTFQTLTNCVRQQIYPELNTTALVDWLEPPEPRNYIPFTPDQIITGTQYYSSVRGDGSATVFTLTHNLATDNVASVLVRANTSGGALYKLGTDYTVTFTNSNVAVVTWLGSVPASNTLLMVVATAGPASVFQSHTHTIGQVVGLQDALDAIAARLSDIEDRLPYTEPARIVDGGTGALFTIPDQAWQYPGKIDAKDASKLLSGPVALPRYKALLSAAHDASATAVTVLPPSPVIGDVYTMDGDDILLPGGYGHKSKLMGGTEGGFFTWDGRQFYEVYPVDEETTGTFWPRNHDIEMFRLSVNSDMLRLGKEFKLEFDVSLQTIGADTDCQYALLIEWGQAQQDTSPATAENLSAVDWLDAIGADVRLIATKDLTKHSFGISVKRSLADAMSANKLLYGAWTAAALAPTTSNFMVRARLARFDTETNASTGDRLHRGAVWAKLSSVKPTF